MGPWTDNPDENFFAMVTWKQSDTVKPLPVKKDVEMSEHSSWSRYQTDKYSHETFAQKKKYKDSELPRIYPFFPK